MANVTINDLTAAGALTAADLMLIRQDGDTEDKKVVLDALRDFFSPGVVTIGEKSGDVTLALTPDALHKVTLTDAVTSWTITGLEIGQGAQVILTNGSAYAVATTGLTADVTGSLASIAEANVRLWVERTESAVYRAVAVELA